MYSLVSQLMLLSRFAHHTPYIARTGIRSASTIVGKSGRREDPRLSIHKAESQGQSLVFKRVSKAFFNLSLRLAAEFPQSRRLRMHVDSNEEENVLIYPYYQNTLLGLFKDDTNISDASRKMILRQTGEAIQELHSEDWIHIDIKPDNILVNWTCDEEGIKTITNVALGNAMWRSPEGQTGRGLSKASDVYSFGLVCLYALGAGETILINDYQELAKLGITPEQEILTRHFSYFGSANDGLLKQIDSEKWSKALKLASQMAELAVEDQPEMRFDVWGQELGSGAQDMIAGMMKPDPRARATIDDVLAHSWWDEVA
ncbi:hypothetical protein HBI06_059500 [Parastagonospora nodorum]|nr:hypothetical protein HBI06_059500 [Parastagonospora nodorum]KAH4249940.1 hypothetical protein HBI05_011710 [Parastagonospora nodorum]